MSNFNSKMVESTEDSKTLKTVVDSIKDAARGESGIKIDPEYQREYKFSKEDESLLIESLILGIPIPVIYLSSDTSKEPYVSNVIDGQHRLRAVYRFLTNEFELSGLEKRKDLNGKKFNELDSTIRSGLQHQRSLKFVNIHTQEDKDIEIEIFKRYNKGNHPLTPQELRHAIYYEGEVNKWVNKKVEFIYNHTELRDIYNISKVKFSDKTAHQLAYVMLKILHTNLDKALNTSPEYADFFMEECYKTNNSAQYIQELEKKWDFINEFLLYLRNECDIKYPFSKDVYRIQTNYKFQTPIFMLLNSFFNYLIENNVDLYKNIKTILRSIEITLQDSYLEDLNFKGSNTRPSALIATYDIFIKNYETLEINKDSSL